MQAAWYDRQGAAADVLQIGELPDPEPAAGEVRVRLTVSAVNPGDTKKRSGWLGNPMAFPRVIPHSDGVGVIDAVGTGANSGRVGERVWVYGAQSYRPFGTAAQLTVVPDHLAVALPERVSDDLAAEPRHPRNHRPPLRFQRRSSHRPTGARPRSAGRRRLDGRSARTLGWRVCGRHGAPGR